MKASCQPTIHTVTQGGDQKNTDGGHPEGFVWVSGHGRLAIIDCKHDKDRDQEDPDDGDLVWKGHQISTISREATSVKLGQALLAEATRARNAVSMHLSFENRLPEKIASHSKPWGSTMAWALLMVPRDRREDAFLFHDFCRYVDDIADSVVLENTHKRRLLDLWLPALGMPDPGDLPEDFRQMVERRDLDRNLLREIILGVRMDTERNRYPFFDDLKAYCRRVASVVGILSASIFGAHGEDVSLYADSLGIALQLTNILRDVKEDAAMGRIYLPLEDLERFGVRESDILESRHTPQMTHLLNHQAERADSYFAKAETAWSGMSVNQRRLMRPARLMRAVYRDLLLQMNRDRYDVFEKRYRVSAFKKAFCLLNLSIGK